VTTLKVVSIKDTNNGSVSTTDDKNYLGVQIGGLSADLIGLESVLAFHTSGVNVKVNKATDTDGVVGTNPNKLDWDSLTTSGMTLASLAVDSAQDVHADGTVALNALSGVLVAKGSASNSIWARSARPLPSNGVTFTNASAVSLTLTGASLFVGTGGSLSAADRHRNINNGNLGFAGSVTTLKVVSIKDTNNGSVSTTDDKNYLGVQIGGLSAESDWPGECAGLLRQRRERQGEQGHRHGQQRAGTVPNKLDWDSLATSGMTLASLAVDSAQDVHADGTVALNALNGVLVAKGSFELDLGQVSTTAASNGVTFANASAVSLTLTGASIFVGTGGSLSAASATADINNGGLGFAGAVTTLKVVSIKDTNNGSVSATDDKNYLGVQIGGLSASLIGLEGVLAFFASGVNVKVNKATDTDGVAGTVPNKLDWDSLTTSGMILATLAVDSAQDVHVDGTVALNALSGVLVAKGQL
jgi:hypothetical protein